MLYLLIGFLLVRGIIFLLPNKGQKKLAKKVLVKETERILQSDTGETTYEGLRKLSFSVTPEQLNLVLDEKETEVFGVIMDLDMSKAIVTVVAFQTGDASLYINTGPEFIGGITHEKVREAALHFVREAQRYLSNATLTYTNPYPDKGYVRFHLRTNKGDYTFQEKFENVQLSNSEYSRLFKLGNNLIAEYRLISETGVDSEISA